MISFRLRAKWQNCRGYVPRYERTPKNGWFDIHSVFATHVETVVLLTHQKQPDDYLRIHVDLDELDKTKSESKATYERVKAYVKNKYDLKVNNLYIDQVKRNFGIIERENYNVGEGKARVPQCPKEKYDAIVDALKYFKMIA